MHFVDIDGDGLKDIVTGKRPRSHGPKGDSDPTAGHALLVRGEKEKDGIMGFMPHMIDNDSGIGTQFSSPTSTATNCRTRDVEQKGRVSVRASPAEVGNCVCGSEWCLRAKWHAGKAPD